MMHTWVIKPLGGLVFLVAIGDAFGLRACSLEFMCWKLNPRSHMSTVFGGGVLGGGLDHEVSALLSDLSPFLD